MAIAVLAAVVVVVAAAMAKAVSKLQLNHQEGESTKEELGTPQLRVAMQTKGASRGVWMETPCGRLLRRAVLIGKRESIEAKTLIKFLSI
jgi:hypothetical protein